MAQENGAEVWLHIYDVSTNANVQQVNRILQAVGTGAFHGGVEVYEAEWSYGYTDSGSGVFCSTPKHCTMHTYQKSVLLGHTIIASAFVKNIIGGLEWTWQGNQYDVLERNCVTFCDEFCKLLGVGPVPAWVRNLSGAGANLKRQLSLLKDSVTHEDASMVHAAVTVQRIWRGHVHRKRFWDKLGPLVEKAKLKAKAVRTAAAKYAAKAALKAAHQLHASRDKAAVCVQRLWRKKATTRTLADQQDADNSGTPRAGNDFSTCFFSQGSNCSDVRKASKVTGYEDGPQVLLRGEGRHLGNCYTCQRGADCSVM